MQLRKLVEATKFVLGLNGWRQCIAAECCGNSLTGRVFTRGGGLGPGSGVYVNVRFVGYMTPSFRTKETGT